MTTSIAQAIESVINAAKGHGKVSKEFAELARPTIGDVDAQLALADTLNTIRRELNVKRDSYVDYLKKRGDDTGAALFVKACLNTFGYAVTVAGKTAGCKFAWNNTKGCYERAELTIPVKKPTAQGKDNNSAEQSSALVAAAEAAPVLAAADKQGHLMGVLSQLLKAGYTLSEVEAAWHGMATKVAADQAAAEVAATAQTPNAPVVLADKVAELQKKGVVVKPARAKKSA